MRTIRVSIITGAAARCKGSREFEKTVAENAAVSPLLWCEG
jgi:hypothetical protein